MTSQPLRVVICALLSGLVVTGAARGRELSFRVRSRSTNTVYLEGGAASGLEVGDRLAVWRQGEQVGEVEVEFAARFSASCRVIVDNGAIRVEDSARKLVDLSAVRDAASRAASRTITQGSPAVPVYTRGTRAPARRTHLAGTLSLDWDSFSDDGPAGLDFDRTSARVSLRGRDLGGMPLSLRVRARTQRLERSRGFGLGATESETRDRLYEVSVRYDGPNDRFSLIGGRLGASPYVGIGFLDGILGELRLFKALSVGGFYGSRPETGDLGFESSGQKYGAFTRLSGANPETARRYNVVLGGVVEEGDVDVSREYMVLESSYSSGGRWSFFQRAEVDFNNDWREELAENTVELSNLSLSAWKRLSDSARLVLSYDQFRQYRTEETRFVSEELFDDLLRQGVRMAVHFGRPRRLSWSLSAGMRDKESGEDPAVNFGFGMRHPDVGAGISLQGDLLGFSNEYQEGGVLRLRTSRRFAGVHELYLDLGTRMAESKLYESVGDLTDSWARLGFWAELPARFFVRGEFEHADGDSVEGTRLSLGLGYRF